MLLLFSMQLRFFSRVFIRSFIISVISGEYENYEEGKIEPSSTMAPRPLDDLFIEPAGNDDVVYGDYNAS